MRPEFGKLILPFAAVGESACMADCITVSGIDTRCVLGINPDERWRLQLVRLSLRLELDGRTAAYSGQLVDTVDYSQITCLSRFVLGAGRFFLVETAVEALCAVIATYASESPLKAVTAELSKPEALPGAACVSYSAHRSVQSYTLVDEDRPFGDWRSIFASKSILIASLRVHAGAALPTELLGSPRAACLALSPGIAGLAMMESKSVAWLAKYDGSRLVNRSSKPCEILLVVPRDGAEAGLAGHS